MARLRSFGAGPPFESRRTRYRAGLMNVLNGHKGAMLNQARFEADMTLREFATKHLLRMKKDDCGDLNILGRRGDIYEYGSGLFAATILRAPNGKHWNKYREAAKATGCRSHRTVTRKARLSSIPRTRVRRNSHWKRFAPNGDVLSAKASD
jgi:hypothetical protein